MKAVVIYHSKTGTTKKYAEAIGDYLRLKKTEVALTSIQEYKDEVLEQTDYLFLGCWTQGLLFFLQHPEKEWIDFAEKLPDIPKPKVALFTTYKILTGSMFRNMRNHLKENINITFTELKSRNGILSETDKKTLDDLINVKN